jgi:hypothetical protein
MGNARRASVCCTLSLIVLSNACEQPAPDGWQGTVADSAGITVVTNREAGLWQPGEAWRVADDLTIGAVDGNPDYLFGSIAGICVGSAGEIVVVDRQVGSVRVFDPAGQLQHIFGSLGEGPGELGAMLAGCFIGPGDTVAIPDLQLYRVSRFLLDGSVIGSVPFDIGNGVPIRWGMRSDGRLVAQLRFGLLDPSAPGTSDALVAEGADGSLAARVLDLPSGEVIARTDGRPRYTLLAPQPAWTLDADGSAWVFGGTDYRLTKYGADGAATMVVTRAAARRAVTDVDRSAVMTAMEETFPPGLISGVMGGVDFAETFPFAYALAMGPEGTLWVRRFRPPSVPPADPNAVVDAGPVNAETFLADPTLRLGSPDWDVFDASGRYLGVVSLPERFEPVTFAADAIYGVWRDGMEVEYVKRIGISNIQ